MLILEIALGVAGGMLLYKALTDTKLGKWLLTGTVWLVVLAVVGGAGFFAWLQWPEQITAALNTAATVLFAALGVAAFLWLIWAWKYSWPRLSWGARISRLTLTAFFSVILFASWVQSMRQDSRWPAAITSIVLGGIVVYVLLKVLPNTPPPGVRAE